MKKTTGPALTLAAASVASAAFPQGSGEELMVSPTPVPSLTTIRLETIRSRDETLLRDLAAALVSRYGDVLEGTEILFTRVETFGTVFYRLDIQDIASEEAARRICHILEMEQCLVARPGASQLVTGEAFVIAPDGLIDMRASSQLLGPPVSNSVEFTPLPTQGDGVAMAQGWEAAPVMKDTLGDLPQDRPDLGQTQQGVNYLFPPQPVSQDEAMVEADESGLDNLDRALAIARADRSGPAPSLELDETAAPMVRAHPELAPRSAPAVSVSVRGEGQAMVPLSQDIRPTEEVEHLIAEVGAVPLAPRMRPTVAPVTLVDPAPLDLPSLDRLTRLPLDRPVVAPTQAAVPVEEGTAVAKETTEVVTSPRPMLRPDRTTLEAQEAQAALVDAPAKPLPVWKAGPRQPVPSAPAREVVVQRPQTAPQGVVEKAQVAEAVLADRADVHLPTLRPSGVMPAAIAAVEASAAPVPGLRAEASLGMAAERAIVATAPSSRDHEDKGVVALWGGYGDQLVPVMRPTAAQRLKTAPFRVAAALVHQASLAQGVQVREWAPESVVQVAQSAQVESVQPVGSERLASIAPQPTITLAHTGPQERADSPRLAAVEGVDKATTPPAPFSVARTLRPSLGERLAHADAPSAVGVEVEDVAQQIASVAVDPVEVVLAARKAVEERVQQRRAQAVAARKPEAAQLAKVQVEAPVVQTADERVMSRHAGVRLAKVVVDTQGVEHAVETVAVRDAQGGWSRVGALASVGSARAVRTPFNTSQGVVRGGDMMAPVRTQATLVGFARPSADRFVGVGAVQKAPMTTAAVVTKAPLVGVWERVKARVAGRGEQVHATRTVKPAQAEATRSAIPTNVVAGPVTTPTAQTAGLDVAVRGADATLGRVVESPAAAQRLVLTDSNRPVTRPQYIDVLGEKVLLLTSDMAVKKPVKAPLGAASATPDGTALRATMPAQSIVGQDVDVPVEKTQDIAAKILKDSESVLSISNPTTTSTAAPRHTVRLRIDHTDSEDMLLETAILAAMTPYTDSAQWQRTVPVGAAQHAPLHPLEAARVVAPQRVSPARNPSLPIVAGVEPPVETSAPTVRLIAGGAVEETPAPAVRGLEGAARGLRDRMRADAVPGLDDERPIDTFLAVWDQPMPLATSEVALATALPRQWGPTQAVMVEPAPQATPATWAAATPPAAAFHAIGQTLDEVQTLEGFIERFTAPDAIFAPPSVPSFDDSRAQDEGARAVLEAAVAEQAGEDVVVAQEDGAPRMLLPLVRPDRASLTAADALPETIRATVGPDSIAMETQDRRVLAPRQAVPASRFAVVFTDTYAVPFDLSGSGRPPLQRTPLLRPDVVSQEEARAALATEPTATMIASSDMSRFFPAPGSVVDVPQEDDPALSMVNRLRGGLDETLGALEVGMFENGASETPVYNPAPAEPAPSRPALNLPPLDTTVRPLAAAPLTQDAPEAVAVEEAPAPVLPSEAPAVAAPAAEVYGPVLPAGTPLPELGPQIPNPVPFAEASPAWPAAGTGSILDRDTRRVAPPTANESLMIRLSYAQSHDEVTVQVRDLMRNFPQSMLEKGRFYGAAAPASPGLFIVGIQAHNAIDRDDLVAYMTNNGIPFVLPGQSAAPILPTQ